MLIFGLLISISPLLIQKGSADTFSNPTLIITEILPNPKGTDKSHEWIEIYNTSKQNINLSNWKFDNGKIAKLPENIDVPPKSYFVIEGENLKITLKNSNAHLNLIDPSDNIVEEINYDKALEDQSYSLTTIKNGNSVKNSWEWTKPTKNSPNPIFYVFTGKITQEPIAGENPNFEIDYQNKPLKITFSETKYSFDLLETLFRKGTTANLFVEKSNNNFILTDFEIINSPPEPESDQTPKEASSHWEYYLLIPIGLLLLTLIFIDARRKRRILFEQTLYRK